MSAHIADVLDAPAEVPFDPTTLGANRWPQVNLLPPEIRSRRALGRIKTRLGVSLLGVLLLAGLGFAFAAMMQAQSASDLAFKQDEVSRLLTEHEKYAAVPQIKSQIEAETQARGIATSTEVLWKDYVEAIQAVAPAGWQLSSFTTAMPTPTDPGLTSPDPLVTPGVGTVTFDGAATAVPEAAAWIDALDSIPGFSGATLTTVAAADDEGTTYYATSGSVQVDASAFANRFAEEEGK